MKKIILLCVILSAVGLKNFGQFNCDSITSPTNNDEDFSVLIAQDSKYYMAWFSDSTGSADIWIQCSEDNGYTWTNSWPAISSSDNNWYPNLGQTNDGIYHLVWFRADFGTGYFNVWYANSLDLINWCSPQNLTNSSTVDWVPHLLIDNNDKMWITWASDRNSPDQQDVWQINSTNGGDSWSLPIQLTNDVNQDCMPFVFQRNNGDYFMIWQRYIGGIFPYITNTCEIWLASSPDGINWGTSISITDEATPVHADVLPAIYEDILNNEMYFSWTTSRLNPLGSIVEIAYSDIINGIPGDQATEISCGGYLGRTYPTEEAGLFHLFWVSDRDGDDNRDISHSILDKRPPVAICRNITVTANDNCQAIVTPEEVDNGSYHPGGQEIYFSLSPEGPYELGETEVTLTVSNQCGSNNTCTATIAVVDDTSPVNLWPPNHKYKNITVDQCLASINQNCPELSGQDIFIKRVKSDEEENATGNGDGNTINDIIIAQDCQSVKLRKERKGNGNGRVYTIYLEGLDEWGTIQTTIMQAHVPHNNGGTAIADGMAYEVYGDCDNKSSFIPSIDKGKVEFNVYPNPFKSTIRISYSLQQHDQINITIYNNIGKEVAILVNEYQLEGNHQVFFNIKYLPAGVYTCVLKTNHGCPGQTTKIIKL